MAPILATATGVTPQKLDDPQLRGLLDSLRSLKVLQQNDDASTAEISLKELNELLAPWKSEWLFEEQVSAVFNLTILCGRETLFYDCLFARRKLMHRTN